jgi:hypothetical protein
VGLFGEFVDFGGMVALAAFVARGGCRRGRRCKGGGHDWLVEPLVGAMSLESDDMDDCIELGFMVIPSSQKSWDSMGVSEVNCELYELIYRVLEEARNVMSSISLTL